MTPEWIRKIGMWLNNIRPRKQLYGRDFKVMEVASGASKQAFDFTVPKGRGDAQAYTFTVAGEAAITDQELIRANVRFDLNGKSSNELRNLFRYSKEYRLSREVITPQTLPQAADLTVTITNPGTKSITVVLTIFYYDPLQNMEIPLAMDDVNDDD